MAIPAAKRRWIDPNTGDYVVEDGGPRDDATHASQVILRIRMQRGSSVYPALGSRLHLIKKNSPGQLRLARAYVREALDDLIKSGAIRDVKISTEAVVYQGTVALGLEVEFTDTDGDRRTVTYKTSFGS